MDFINQLNLGSGLEIAIIAAICFAVTQAAKQTNISNHFMPWISMLVGIIAGEVAGLSQGDNHYLSLAILGFLIGAATVGLFDGFKLPYQAAKNQNAADTAQKAEPINDQKQSNLQDIISNTKNNHYNQLDTKNVSPKKEGVNNDSIRS